MGSVASETNGCNSKLTKDKRILIRNTAEYHNPMNMSKSTLKKRALKQKMGIKKGSQTYLIMLSSQLGQALYQELGTAPKYLMKLTKYICSWLYKLGNRSWNIIW